MPYACENLVEENESDYLSVRHFLLWGTEQEIGRSLAEIGTKHYDLGASDFARYIEGDSTAFAQARLLYYQRNWPEMLQRMQGVAGYFNIDLANDARDVSALVYDVSANSVPRVNPKTKKRQAPVVCSAIFLPPLCTKDKTPIVARNFDAWDRLPGMIFSNNGRRYTRKLYSRSFVMEISPNEGNAVLAFGGHDLLSPFQDVLNDKGLFITSLADGEATIEDLHMAGHRNTGLISRQVLILLASRCSTVAEAKKEILAHQLRMDINLHWLIADAEGNATVLEVDDHGCFIFVDADPAEPFPVTNHRLSMPTDLGTHAKERPYRTHRRLLTLKEAAAEMARANQRQFTREEGEMLMDKVACAYNARGKKAAGVDPAHNTLTIWTLTADLKKKDIEIGFYLRSRRRHSDPTLPHRKAIEWKRWRLEFGFRRTAVK